ncbi:MAG: hypothetical protein NWE98_07425 [Candidatus Bathyarchaeota archaeon]|nr:hypothetical protein [Candidatus Bathyarchaeota archaeon]
MRGHIALAAMLVVSVILLVYSLQVGVQIGADWFGKDANFQWHMNNYIVIDAKYAYSIFGLATLAIGGLATGLAMAAFFTFRKNKKHILILISAFFIAIIMTGLGFNTLDFMLGCFYWTNMTYPPPVHVAVLGPVDVWNFYFFFFVAPLWFSGFLMGSATSYYAFIYQPKRVAATYLAKRSLTGLLNHTRQPKEYLAESAVFSRSRNIVEQTFENTN